MADSDRMPCLLHIAQEMGGPLNVVIGRMEYLLKREADKETTYSLNAIMPQAQRLVELRQQLIDEASAALTDVDIDSPASTREAERPDA
jgi:signal transduction histidine kinase